MSGNEGTLFIGGASRRVTPRLVTIGRDEKGGGLESRQRFSGGLSSLLSVIPRRERESRIFNFKGHGFMHTVGAYQGGERKGREVRVDLNDCALPPPGRGVWRIVRGKFRA